MFARIALTVIVTILLAVLFWFWALYLAYRMIRDKKNYSTVLYESIVGIYGFIWDGATPMRNNTNKQRR
ncbi:MAG: FeoB-associated Cys-rich membrane protein [Clostridiales bacterium]|jgi:ABC-type transporter Mla subunit MlaD|nr:FeoB-associated Cys-rich membrane protein [Clostridiales bacterium]